MVQLIAARLRKVTRETLKHELSPLRRLAKWAHARGYLPHMPEIETPGARVLGTPVLNARKRVSLIFTAEEVAAIVARLPTHWSAPRAQIPYPVQARYIVAWETALRPRTMAKLAAPSDYRRGALTLQIRDEVDKNRFGRELPPSDAARAALDSVCPASGLIFGHHDCIMLLRRAAKATPTGPSASRTTTSGTPPPPTWGGRATTCPASCTCSGTSSRPPPRATCVRRRTPPKRSCERRPGQSYPQILDLFW
jgi:hypothetical protein